MDFKDKLYKAFVIKAFETVSLLMFHVVKWAFWESLCTSTQAQLLNLQP